VNTHNKAAQADVMFQEIDMNNFSNFKNTVGNIIKRQTTFLNFIDTHSGQTFKISYKNKCEFNIDDGMFSGLTIMTDHPLLEQHNFTSTNIYISSAFAQSEFIIEHMSSAISSHYKGWRTIEDYCNAEYGISKLLNEGNGLIYNGPPTGAEIIKEILTNFKISHSSTFFGKQNESNYKVLFLGNNYVVAQDFSIDEFET